MSKVKFRKQEQPKIRFFTWAIRIESGEIRLVEMYPDTDKPIPQHFVSLFLPEGQDEIKISQDFAP